MTATPQRLTGARLASDLRSGVLDAVDLAERTLAGIAGYADRAVFTGVLTKRALGEAEAARKRLKEGRPASALDGVPVAWKDLFDVEGRVTTAGSVVLKGNPPAARDAALLAAGVRAGQIGRAHV